MGRLTSLTMRCVPSFLTSEQPFCACVVGKVSLTLRMRNMWSLIWTGLKLLLLFILECLSTGDKLQLFGLGPIYLLPQKACHLSTTSHPQPSRKTPLLFKTGLPSSFPKSDATGGGEPSIQPQLQSEVDKYFHGYRMEREFHERGTCQDYSHSIHVF